MMRNGITSLGMAAVMGGVFGWGADLARPHDDASIPRPARLGTGPGRTAGPLQPRGGDPEEIFAGFDGCVPRSNTLQVGIDAPIQPDCADGQWVSLAYPFLTGGATITAINIVHNTNTGVGDLHLVGDCGGNPDTNAILWTGCGCIAGAVGGAVTNYCIGDPIVEPPAVVWVVAVFHESFSFDIAFDCLQDGPGHGYGNLVGTGRCGDWVDLNGYTHGDECNPGGTFGGCAWVSLVVDDSPPEPVCCDSPAACAGDANGDGVVNPLDTGAVLSRFGLDASDPANCQYDVNCDGQIDPLDAGYVLARLGSCVPPDVCPLGGGAPGECGGAAAGCGDRSCPGPPPRDCCVVHTEPGCDAVCGVPDDGDVEQCVCDFDSFCCGVVWDTACVEFVGELGCADCSADNPDCGVPAVCGPGAGDCCASNGTAGCEDGGCCAEVCVADRFCCDSAWDQLCADRALEICEVCGGAG